jgi:hypothetical protein
MAIEIVSVSQKLSPTFYILLFITIAVVVAIIILIRKLNYTFKQISKSVGIALLITICINIILLILMIVLLPYPKCKIGFHCPSSAETFLSLSPYAMPAIFLIVLLIYLIIKAIKSKR